MSSQSAYGVGVCLSAHGVVVAVVRANPMRLAAVAEVAGSLTGAKPLSRRLARARRQLGLPRWCSTSMVDELGGPGETGGHGGRRGHNGPDGPATSRPEFAALLARAGFLPTAVLVPAQLRHLRNNVDLGVGVAVDRRLIEAMADEAHGWATAAALNAFPEPSIAGRGGRHVGPDDFGSDVGQWDSRTAETGWAVERVSASGEREQQTEETPCVAR
ncbi:hypothetical protein SAMN05443287_11626 [Micromonospora phaseoli]|uniref:Uncharacterized protein n=1 Tax=Micromonospora phaseoli TaxID=1144548 RepID=A0A1H7DQ10_9ACTN|nr:hypothetical protein [Micromonospora phaseoli]PZV90021.1 hypothetical protein CLV64_114108 [Micromonospora phaseoli]GIJ78762.1 hypothetical protein Xph01_31940 [Micromonospora phaseoli]SEK03849.1 hypothetical protein SAMN05443287_11626 [Micromonospora phaseoli]